MQLTTLKVWFIMSNYEKETVRFMRIKDVSKLVGFSESTIRRYEKGGVFPPSIKITKRTSVWKEQDVRDWLDSFGGE